MTRRMGVNRLILWTLAAAFTCGFGLSVVSAVHLSAMEQKAQDAQERAEVVAGSITFESNRYAELDTLLSEVTAEHATRAAVLAEREPFLEAVRAADAAFTAAEGKAEVADLRGAVIAAQNAVASEETDAGVVRQQTEVVNAQASQAAERTAAADERVRQEVASLKPAPRQGMARAPQAPEAPFDWFADARARLDKFGGGHVELREFDGNCGSVSSVRGCAYSDGYIAVHHSLGDMSPAKRDWVMMHELAHMYHFTLWDQVNNSAGYKRLFDSDPELLANCMASSRGITNHGHHWRCSPEHIEWARHIWISTVPE